MSTIELSASLSAAAVADDPSEWLQRVFFARYDDDPASADAMVGADGAPRAGQWRTFAEMIDPEHPIVRDLYNGLRTTGGYPPQASAVFSAAWTAGVAAEIVGLGLATGAGFLLDPSLLRWWQNPEGWMDGVDVGPTTIVVTADHPWADHPRAEIVEDLATVRARAIAAVVETVTPLIDACHRLTRVGKAGLWNEVGDALAMVVAHQRQLPITDAAVDMLVTAVRLPSTPWKAKPMLRFVEQDGERICVTQKGGCCLAYTRPDDGSHEHHIDENDMSPDAIADRAYSERFPHVPGEVDYCSTCSKRDEQGCIDRQVFWQMTLKARRDAAE